MRRPTSSSYYQDTTSLQQHKSTNICTTTSTGCNLTSTGCNLNSGYISEIQFPSSSSSLSSIKKRRKISTQTYRFCHQVYGIITCQFDVNNRNNTKNNNKKKKKKTNKIMNNRTAGGSDEVDDNDDSSSDCEPLTMTTATQAATTTTTTTTCIIYVAAILYIGSGICQPLLMQVCKNSGLANSQAQLYMIAYYFGPAMLIFTLQQSSSSTKSKSVSISSKQQQNLQIQQQHDRYSDSDENDNSNIRNNTKQQQQLDGILKDDNTTTSSSSSSILGTNTIPDSNMIIKATFIALFDIIAQSLNYTGASMAGATIFAVVYSSVTIWTAVFSYLFLNRSISYSQWLSIFIVFIGLCITTYDSILLGSNIIQGTILIMIGSCFHGGTYVMSEAIMIHTTSTTNGSSKQQQKLSIHQNTSIQGMVALIGLTVWQIVYTIPHWDSTIRQPMLVAQTTIVQALVIMLLFCIANFIHSISFYYVLKYYPGGSISAGVMKGLQAVLVFIFAHYLFCHHPTLYNTDTSGNNKNNNNGMCFTIPKLISLITVVCGVLLFSYSTTTTLPTKTQGRRGNYTPIETEVI